MICQILRDSTVSIRDDVFSSGSSTDLTGGMQTDILFNHQSGKQGMKASKSGNELVSVTGKTIFKADSVGSV